MEATIELDDFVTADEDDADEEAADEETSFSFQPIEPPEQASDRITSLRRENLQSAVDDYYTKLTKQEGTSVKSLSQR